MRKLFYLVLLLLLVCSHVSEALAQRTGRCLVTDPTGTQLNVRVEPQGRVLFSLPNGYAVELVHVAKDYKGQPWALVRDWRSKAIIGWVFREFVSCY